MFGGVEERVGSYAKLDLLLGCSYSPGYTEPTRSKSLVFGP